MNMNKFMAALVGALILMTSAYTPASAVELPKVTGPLTDTIFCKTDADFPGQDVIYTNEKFVKLNEESGGEVVGIATPGTTLYDFSLIVVESIMGPKPDELKIEYFLLWELNGQEYISFHGNPCVIGWISNVVPIPEFEASE